MKRININNGDYLEIKPTENGLSVERRDQNGNLEREEYVPDGDFVMLMNYWRNCKHGIEKSDYISSF